MYVRHRFRCGECKEYHTFTMSSAVRLMFGAGVNYTSTRVFCASVVRVHVES
jgi:outer membrane protein W